MLKGDYGVTTTFNPIFLALYQYGGTHSPVPYYLWMILSHWGASLALLGLGMRLVGTRAALLAAAAFAVFWGNHQTVMWIAVGYRPLCAALFMIAVALWVDYRARGGNWRLVALGLAGALALFAKEDATPLLAVVVAAHLLLPENPRGGRWIRGPWAPYAPLVIIYLAYAALQPHVRTVSAEGTHLVPQYGIGVHAVRNALDCVPQMLFPDLARGGFRHTAQRLLPGDAVEVAAAALVALRVAFSVAALWLLIRGPGVVRFLVAWMYLTFTPFMFFSYEYAVSARYRYLPALGLCLLLGYGLAHAQRRLDGKRWAQVGLWAALLAAVVVNLALLRGIQAELARVGEMRRQVVAEIARAVPSVPAGTVFRFEGLPPALDDAVMSVMIIYDEPVGWLRPRDRGEPDVVVIFENLRVVDVKWRASPGPQASASALMAASMDSTLACIFLRIRPWMSCPMSGTL